jgi:hypothetical protein
MICEKCNKQFKSELSAVKTGTMMGICTSCGRRLKYNDIPEGYATGAILALPALHFSFSRCLVGLISYHRLSLLVVPFWLSGC